MTFLLPILEKNIRAISPQYSQILEEKGYCFGLNALWMQAVWVGHAAQFKKRLVTWLARDLSQKPIKINGQTFHSFDEIMIYFDSIKLKSEKTFSEKEFIRLMFDTLAFIEALMLYNMPMRTVLAPDIKIQNLVRAYPFARLSVLENVEVSLNYNNLMFLSEETPGKIEKFLKKLEEILGDIPTTIELSVADHTLGISKIEGIWQLLEQNLMTKENFYQAAKTKTVLAVLNEDNVDSWVCRVQVYTSPLVTLSEEIKLQLQALQVSEINEKITLMLASEAGCLPLVKQLCEGGVDVNAQDVEGMTALHHAAKNGELETQQYLLTQNANPHIKTQDALTAVHFAAQNGHFEQIKSLVAAGAALNVVDKHGTTPLHLAALRGYGEIVEYILKQDPTSVNQATRFGSTPLHFAAQQDNLSIIGKLAAAGADLGAQDKNKRTPLDLAIIKKQKTVARFLEASASIAPITNDNRKRKRI